MAGFTIITSVATTLPLPSRRVKVAEKQLPVKLLIAEFLSVVADAVEKRQLYGLLSLPLNCVKCGKHQVSCFSSC